MSLRDDLRTLADRPLDRDQRGLLAGALLVLVIVAAATLFLGRANGDDASAPRTADLPAPPAGTPDPAAPAVENELLEPPPPPEAVPLPDELLARHSRPLTAKRQKAAERAGRRCRDFLRYQDGRLAARRISAATGELRTWIGELPRGRGTPAVRQNPARLLRVRAQALDPRSAVVAATVERLGARYPLRMMAREVRGGRWLVTALQSDPDASE